MNARPTIFGNLLLAALLLGVALSVIAQEDASDRLIGTWRIVETVTSDGSGETIDDNPPPGMYMFTDKFMSNLIVPEWEPRPVITKKLLRRGSTSGV